MDEVSDLRVTPVGSHWVVLFAACTGRGAHALNVFIARAAEALCDMGSDLFVSFGSRRPGAHFEVQRLITETGFEIRALTRDFNDYVGAGALGGTSHLYHLTATAELRRRTPERYEGPLYTGARRRTDAMPSTSRRRETRSPGVRDFDVRR